MNRLELEFPLHWEYKIIATQAPKAYEAICAVIAAHGFSHAPKAGNVSRNGKYVTYTVRMHIVCRDQLDAMTQALSSCAGVKYLL
jgi:putative lipoic acid-binding regulatory protein